MLDDESGGGDLEPVSPERIAHALRRIRADRYRVDADATGVRLALTMRSSLAGRRNAASQILTLLAAQGLVLVAPDPVEELAQTDGALPVRPITR